MTEGVTPEPAEDVAARAGAREWAGLVVLTLPVLLVSMDMTVLHLALPAITADLEPSGTELLWIVDIYAFVVAGLLITMGGVGDRIGRRRLLLIGAAGFAVASVAAAFAPTPGVLIAARAALGVAGATLAPSTLSLIRTMFANPRQRSTAVSVWVLTFLAGGAIGPVVGGVLLQIWWWGAVFLLAIPIMVILLMAGPFLLPEWRSTNPGRVDLTSAALSLAGIFAVVYAIKEFAAHGPDILPVLIGVAGIGVLVVFLRRQRRLTHPLIDVDLFRGRPFTLAITVLTIGVVVLAGISFLTAQYLQLVLALTPLEAGLWTLPPLAVGIVAVMIHQALHARVSPAVLTGAGLSIAAGGLIVIAQAPTTGVTVVVVGLALLFAGVMPVLAAGVDTVTSAAPPERAGAAAALSETTQELGGALGIAVLGSVATLVYRQYLQPLLNPLPAADRLAADTLAGAQQHSTALGADVVNAAATAFTTGMHTAVLIGAGLLLLTVAAVGVLQRRYAEERPPRSEAG